MEFLTKNADVALVEVKEKIYEQLGAVRRMKHDFAGHARIDPVWEGILTRCNTEERFLSELLDLIERS